MLELGPVRIGREDVRWIRWSEGEVVLGLRWRWEEVPVLVDLSDQVLLRWKHLDDREAGLSVIVQQGRFDVNDDEGRLRLTLRRCDGNPTGAGGDLR